jgi:hypothetical protein
MSARCPVRVQMECNLPASAENQTTSRFHAGICLLLGVLGCEGAQIEGPPVAPTSTGPSATAGVASSGAGTGNGGAGNVPTNGGSTGAGLTGSGAGGGAPVAGGAGGAAGSAATGGAPAACTTPAPAPRAPLRRITRFEYNNSTRDLFGVDLRLASALPGEELGSGFGNDADYQSSSRLLIDGYMSVAQQLAKEVTKDAPSVTRTAGCDPASGEATCQQTFLTGYLTRAFRRPATADDLASYQATFTQGVMLGGDFASGVRAVVERSLQSAQFLYRIEAGTPVDAARGLARPTGYEMATRLSYLLWSSMPDQALRDAAAQGKLDTKEGVLDEARRLLADPRAKDSIRNFHQLLFETGGLDHVERDAGLYPAFKPGTGSLLRQETALFLDDVVWSGGGDLASVFTAPYTFVNGALAAFYGIPNVTGDAFQKVNVDVSKRSGLLTQGSILTLTTPGSRTDPVVRGKWLYTRLLCGAVPDPPPDVPKLPDPVPGQSVRQRLEMHRAADECKGCHTLMDPIGLAFEHFDGVGLWRDTDNGAEIDDSGNIPVSDVKGPFNGALEFAQRVSQSRDVRKCYVSRYLTYAYGRAIKEADCASRTVVESAFEGAQGNIKELMIAVTQSDAFLSRALVAPAQSGDVAP